MIPLAIAVTVLTGALLLLPVLRRAMFRLLTTRLKCWYHRICFRSDLRTFCCPFCEVELDDEWT